MKLVRSLAVTACIAASITVLSSCVRKSFDAPPDQSNYDPQLHVTTTIAQLLAMNAPYSSSGGDDTTLVNDSIVISGVVTANDASGNLYKQIVIQDSTAAIMILADAYSLYGNYPVGRKVYIRCKGLYLGYDGGIPEIGGAVNEQAAIIGIAGTNIESTIVKADVGHAVPDTVVTMAQVKTYQPFLVNRLITIKDVEFEDTTVTYTDPTATTNRYIEDCSGNSLVLRTSNYALFHGANVPHGKGSITGIYTVYTTTKSTPQLLIRDTTDVTFTDYRCGSGPTPPPGNGSIITIDSLRKLYTGTDVSLTGYKIAGVVISDYGNKNVGKDLIIENGGKGIDLYFGTATPVGALGDSIVVDLTGLTLTSYNGELEIKTAAASAVTPAGTGAAVVPYTVTTAQLNANITAYENVLVKITGATLSGGATFSGSRTITDASGTATLYTGSTATFAANPLPTTTVTVLGIATPYQTTVEVKMRNASDIQ